MRWVCVADCLGDALSEQLPALFLPVSQTHPEFAVVAEDGDGQVLSHFGDRAARPAPDSILGEDDGFPSSFPPGLAAYFRGDVFPEFVVDPRLVGDRPLLGEELDLGHCCVEQSLDLGGSWRGKSW